MEVNKFHFKKILQNKKELWKIEKTLIGNYKTLLAIDEAGRGAIAGPLSLAGIYLDKTAIKILEKNNIYFYDSKTLNHQKRIFYMNLIKKLGIPNKTLLVSNKKIDKIGINNAFLNGIQKIYQFFQPGILILDGIKIKNLEIKHFSFIKGGERLPSIGGASILAKTKRDLYMIKIAKKFSEYLFEIHKGYGTKKHYQLLKKYGFCSLHRKSFLKDFKF